MEATFTGTDSTLLQLQCTGRVCTSACRINFVVPALDVLRSPSLTAERRCLHRRAQQQLQLRRPLRPGQRSGEVPRQTGQSRPRTSPQPAAAAPQRPQMTTTCGAWTPRSCSAGAASPTSTCAPLSTSCAAAAAAAASAAPALEPLPSSRLVQGACLRTALGRGCCATQPAAAVRTCLQGWLVPKWG